MSRQAGVDGNHRAELMVVLLLLGVLLAFGPLQAPLLAQDSEVRVQRIATLVRARLVRLAAEFEVEPDDELRRVYALVQELLRQGRYRFAVPSNTSSIRHLLAQERDGTIVVNRDHFSLLSDGEAEALIFHELTHMLPWQSERTAIAKAIDRRLPASPGAKQRALLAPTPEGRALRRDYKRLLSLEATNELESYLWQFGYMTALARESGHRTLDDYLAELAKTTRLSSQAKVYREWLAARQQGRIAERLVIGQVLHVAGPTEWPLLRELAADEGVDVASSDAIEAWIVSWAMEPERHDGRWLWVGAGLLVVVAAVLWWKRRRHTAAG